MYAQILVHMSYDCTWGWGGGGGMDIVIVRLRKSAQEVDSLTGSESFATLGTWTCISIRPCFSAGLSTELSPPIIVYYLKCKTRGNQFTGLFHYIVYILYSLNMIFDCIVTLHNLNNKWKSKQEFPKQDIGKLTLLKKNSCWKESFTKCLLYQTLPPPPTKINKIPHHNPLNSKWWQSKHYLQQ